MERWSGKVAIVTGAGSGIGAAVTEELAKSGVKVFGVDILVEKVEELKQKLGKGKGEIVPFKCDLSKEKEIEAAFKALKEKFGKVHILVYAAGIARLGLITEIKPEDTKKVFEVNTIGLITCTQNAYRLMKESGVDDGHIVLINSIGGHYVPNPGGVSRYNVYNASKFSVTGFTESFRQELVYLKSKIRITSVSPGSVITNFRAHTAIASGIKPENDDQSVFKGSPRLNAKDVADAVVYAISTPPHVQVHEIIIKPVGELF